MSWEDTHKRCLELLKECEADEVQEKLSDWEREFLDSNLERRDKELPFKSEKVLEILERIAAKPFKAPSRRYH